MSSLVLRFSQFTTCSTYSVVVLHFRRPHLAGMRLWHSANVPYGRMKVTAIVLRHPRDRLNALEVLERVTEATGVAERSGRSCSTKTGIERLVCNRFSSTDIISWRVCHSDTFMCFAGNLRPNLGVARESTGRIGPSSRAGFYGEQLFTFCFILK